MCAEHRDAEDFSRQHVRSARATSDVSGAAGSDAAITALRPPQPEFDHGFSSRCQADPGRLRGNERLKIDHVKESCLNQLRVKDWALHPEERFLREDDCPLRHRIDIAVEFKSAQVLKESLFKQRLTIVSAQTGQIFQI